MPLNEATGIRRAQFNTDAMLLTTNSMVIPISDKVECYNKTTGDWFKPGEDGDHKAALNLALAFSDDITVYYDRSPEEGGKGPHRRCGMSFVLPKVYQKTPWNPLGSKAFSLFPLPYCLPNVYHSNLLILFSCLLYPYPRNCIVSSL